MNNAGMIGDRPALHLRQRRRPVDRAVRRRQLKSGDGCMNTCRLQSVLTGGPAPFTPQVPRRRSSPHRQRGRQPRAGARARRWPFSRDGGMPPSCPSPCLRACRSSPAPRARRTRSWTVPGDLRDDRADDDGELRHDRGLPRGGRLGAEPAPGRALGRGRQRGELEVRLQDLVHPHRRELHRRTAGEPVLSLRGDPAPPRRDRRLHDDDVLPLRSTTREAMAVFVLIAKDRNGEPARLRRRRFDDVPASSPFCRWIEELARLGVAGGCGGGNYCPSAPVTRDQMAVFVCARSTPRSPRPPAATRVQRRPASSPFCRWIEELRARAWSAAAAAATTVPRRR